MAFPKTGSARHECARHHTIEARALIVGALVLALAILIAAVCSKVMRAEGLRAAAPAGNSSPPAGAALRQETNEGTPK